jgi:hypothetical protein
MNIEQLKKVRKQMLDDWLKIEQILIVMMNI